MLRTPPPSSAAGNTKGSGSGAGDQDDEIAVGEDEIRLALAEVEIVFDARNDSDRDLLARGRGRDMLLTGDVRLGHCRGRAFGGLGRSLRLVRHGILETGVSREIRRLSVHYRLPPFSRAAK